MAQHAPRFADSVFINCPFDRDYWPLFEAMVFCILDSGFVPRCALEEPDSGEARVRRFSTVLPEYCDRQGLDRHDLQFPEYVTLIEEWLKSA